MAAAESDSHVVLATHEARNSLTTMLKEFRNRGVRAEPVVFGAHRKPEGVVMSYGKFLELTRSGNPDVENTNAVDNDFWSAKSLEELATEQGVALRPGRTISKADLWRSDEEFDAFLSYISESRHRDL